jgi:hypothetical protein
MRRATDMADLKRSMRADTRACKSPMRLVDRMRRQRARAAARSRRLPTPYELRQAALAAAAAEIIANANGDEAFVRAEAKRGAFGGRKALDHMRTWGLELW